MTCEKHGYLLVEGTVHRAVGARVGQSPAVDKCVVTQFDPGKEEEGGKKGVWK